MARLILGRSEEILYMISLMLFNNVCPMTYMWSVLVNSPYTLVRNVYSFVWLCVFQVSIRSRYLIADVQVFYIPALIFYLLLTSTTKIKVLKFPSIIVDLSIFPVLILSM